MYWLPMRIWIVICFIEVFWNFSNAAKSATKQLNPNVNNFISSTKIHRRSNCKVNWRLLPDSDEDTNDMIREEDSGDDSRKEQPLLLESDVLLKYGEAQYLVKVNKSPLKDKCTLFNPDESDKKDLFRRFKFFFPNAALTNEFLEEAYNRFLVILGDQTVSRAEQEVGMKRKERSLTDQLKLSIFALKLHRLLACLPVINCFEYINTLTRKLDQTHLVELLSVVRNYAINSLETRLQSDVNYLHRNLMDLVKFLNQAGIFTKEFRKTAVEYRNLSDIPVDNADLFNPNSWFSHFVRHVRHISTYSKLGLRFLVDPFYNSEDNVELDECFYWLLMPIFIDDFVDRFVIESLLKKLALSSNLEQLEWLLNVYASKRKYRILYDKVQSEFLIDDQMIWKVVDHVLKFDCSENSCTEVIKLFTKQDKILLDISKNEFGLIDSAINTEKFSDLIVLLDAQLFKRNGIKLPLYILENLLEQYGEKTLKTCLSLKKSGYDSAPSIRREYSRVTRLVGDLFVLGTIIQNFVTSGLTEQLNVDLFNSFLAAQDGLLYDSSGSLMNDCFMISTGCEILNETNKKLVKFMAQSVIPAIVDFDFLVLLYKRSNRDVFRYVLNQDQHLKMIKKSKGNIFRYLYDEYENSKKQLKHVIKNGFIKEISYLRILFEPTPVKNLHFYIEEEDYRLIIDAIKEECFELVEAYFSEDNIRITGVRNALNNHFVKRALQSTSNLIIEQVSYFNSRVMQSKQIPQTAKNVIELNMN